MKTEKLTTIDDAQLDGVAGGAGVAESIGAGLGQLIDGEINKWEARMAEFCKARGWNTLAGVYEDLSKV